MTSPRVLVTGASGYVGGRVVPALLARGLQVRCLARTPAKLRVASWFDQVEVVEGSVEGDLSDAMAGVSTAIYLVHAIGEGADWVERELEQARNFAASAAVAGVERIVYLGGLGDEADALSTHLSSRQDVGAALAATGIPVIELRAGVIIGSGSASFEMLRYLVDVLPIMVTPKWVSTRCQPISIADAVELVVAAVVDERPLSGVLEGGGADVVNYAEMMETYARCAGLRSRILLPVPVLSPRLSSHWIGLVTPVPVPLAKELVQSLVNEVIVTQRSACDELGVKPLTLEESITRALDITKGTGAPTTFSDTDLTYFNPNELDPEWAGGTEFADRRSAESSATPDELFAELSTIGGEKGWYGGRLLWQDRCGWCPTRPAGGSRRWSPQSDCDCAPRCVCRVWHGSPGRSRRAGRGPTSSRSPPSGLGGCSVASIGMGCCPSTTSSSRPCSIASLPHQNVRRRRLTRADACA